MKLYDACRAGAHTPGRLSKEHSRGCSGGHTLKELTSGVELTSGTNDIRTMHKAMHKATVLVYGYV